MVPLPPVVAGTWNSVTGTPAVKVRADTEPVPNDGAESVPRMVTVAEEGVPMVPVVGSAMLDIENVMVSSGSAAPSL